MTVEIGNTTLTNTFDYWRNRTNEMADAMSTKVVTVESNTAVGNAAISGTFTANVFSGNGSLLTSVDAETVGGNTVSTINSYTDSKAATAYSNATSYSLTIAGTAYSNAVSTAATDATNKAGNAYSNAVSTAATDATNKAGNAYSNAVSFASSAAATAYSNATSYADTAAGTAYSNATSYADIKAANAYSNSVSYVNSKTLSQATWQAGTSTTEALISPAKFKAGVDSLVTFTSTTVSNAYAGAGLYAVGQFTLTSWTTGINNPGQTPPFSVGTVYSGGNFGLSGTWRVEGRHASYATYYSNEYGWWVFLIKRVA